MRNEHKRQNPKNNIRDLEIEQLTTNIQTAIESVHYLHNINTIYDLQFLVKKMIILPEDEALKHCLATHTVKTKVLLLRSVISKSIFSTSKTN